MTYQLFYFMEYYSESILLQELKINLHSRIEIIYQVFYEMVNQPQFLKFSFQLFKTEVLVSINRFLRISELE